MYRAQFRVRTQQALTALLYSELIMRFNLVSLNTEIPDDDRVLGYDSRAKTQELEGEQFAQGLPPSSWMVRPLGAGQFEWVEVGSYTWIDANDRKAVAMLLPEYLTAEVAEAALIQALSKGAKLLCALDSIERQISGAKPVLDQLSAGRKEAIIGRIIRHLEEI